MHAIALVGFGKTGQSWLRVLAVAIALAPAAFPQMMGRGIPPSQGEPGANGFDFYGLSGYFGYTSTAVPFTAVLPVPGLNLGPNYLAGGSASAGYQHIGGRTDAHITYTLSYDASLRYSSWNSMNHYLTFGVAHELTPRLTYSLTGSAITMRWDQFLFAPTVLSEVADTPATFDDLVSAILSGKLTNSQLASILTGAPMLDSPAATILYGTRFFTSALKNQFTYALSTRLRLYGGFGATRTQHLTTDAPQLDGVYLVPDTTTGMVTTGFGYSVSPVTTLGFEAQANRTFSRYEDAYTSTGLVTAARVFGRHWIVEGRGGVGMFEPVRQTYSYKPGPHYVAGGNITYKGLSQSMTVEYMHSIVDTSGIGAESSDMASGIWRWQRPGQRWALFAQGRYTSLSESSLSNINAWLGGAGIMRIIDRHAIIRLAYMYGRNAGFIGGTLANTQLEGVNLLVSWSRHPLGL